MEFAQGELSGKHEPLKMHQGKDQGGHKTEDDLFADNWKSESLTRNCEVLVCGDPRGEVQQQTVGDHHLVRSA